MRYAEHFAPSGRLQQRTHRRPLKKGLEFMKKSIMNICTVIALCAAMALSFAACGSADEEVVGADPSTWGPVEHDSLAAAEEETGLDMSIPQEILGAKPGTYLTWYEQKYIDTVYTDEAGNIVARVRKADGSGDISGDYNEYTEVSEEQIENYTVTMKGEDGKIMLASWTADGASYALCVDAGADAETIRTLIQNIK